MNPDDAILRRQLGVIRKVIDDETWLEGERRGHPVTPDDHAVRENVCRVVLQIGQRLREQATQSVMNELSTARS